MSVARATRSDYCGALSFSSGPAFEVLQKNYLCLPLNYYCAVLQAQFLEAVTQWHGLNIVYCGSIHPAHTFSCALIDQLAFLPDPPCILHIFGFNSHDQMLVDCACKNKVDLISVKLG